MSFVKTGLVVAVVLVVCACAQGRSRYVAARDPGSRGSARYVQDRQTGKWVIRDVELRVSVDRALPDPLQDPEHGSLLSASVFGPISVSSGLLYSLNFEIRDGYRVWHGGQIMHGEDLQGKISYGVTVEWPRPGQPTTSDALEMFRLSPPGDTPPDVWSEWQKPDSYRKGDFAWLAEVQGAGPESPRAPEYPFEVRFRYVLKNAPAVMP